MACTVTKRQASAVDKRQLWPSTPRDVPSLVAPKTAGGGLEHRAELVRAGKKCVAGTRGIKREASVLSTVRAGGGGGRHEPGCIHSGTTQGSSSISSLGLAAPRGQRSTTTPVRTY